jgi:hypothetical protein
VSKDLTPTAGARFVLEHVGPDGRYDGRIVTPTSEYAYDVSLTAGEEPVMRVRGDAAPNELQGMLVMIARLCARGATRRAEDGLPMWPARITRWRGPGRGG